MAHRGNCLILNFPAIFPPADQTKQVVTCLLRVHFTRKLSMIYSLGPLWDLPDINTWKVKTDENTEQNPNAAGKNTGALVRTRGSLYHFLKNSDDQRHDTNQFLAMELPVLFWVSWGQKRRNPPCSLWRASQTKSIWINRRKGENNKNLVLSGFMNWMFYQTTLSVF